MALCIGISGVVAVGAANAAGNAGAQSKALTPLQRGLQYYRGKTLTYIVGSAAGTGGDLIGRVYAQYIGLYLHATVNVEDVPQGNLVTAQDDVAGSPRNGLTIGSLAEGSDIQDAVTNVPALNFNPARVDILGGGLPNAYLLIGAVGSPYVSFASLKDKANEPVRIVDLTSGTPNIYLRLLVAAFGINADVITGYATSASLIAGFLRGDAPVTLQNISQTGPVVAANKAVILAVVGKATPGLDYASLAIPKPTVQKLAAEYPPKTATEKKALAALEAIIPANGNYIFAPSGTPTYLYEALLAAVRWAFKNPQEIAATKELGNNPTFVSGAQGKAEYLAGLKLAQPVAYIIEGLSAP